MICANCGNEIKEGSAFCRNCGAPVPKTVDKQVCAKCGEEIKPGQEFCARCGTKVKIETAGEPQVKSKGSSTKLVKRKWFLPVVITAGVVIVLVILFLAAASSLGAFGAAGSSGNAHKTYTVFKNSDDNLVLVDANYNTKTVNADIKVFAVNPGGSRICYVTNDGALYYLDDQLSRNKIDNNCIADPIKLLVTPDGKGVLYWKQADQADNAKPSSLAQTAPQGSADAPSPLSGEGNSLYYYNLSTDSKTLLFTLSGKKPQQACISPNKQFFVLSELQSSGEWALIAINLSTGQRSQVYNSVDAVAPISISNDGRMIIFEQLDADNKTLAYSVIQGGRVDKFAEENVQTTNAADLVYTNIDGTEALLKTVDGSLYDINANGIIRKKLLNQTNNFSLVLSGSDYTNRDILEEVSAKTYNQGLNRYDFSSFYYIRTNDTSTDLYYMDSSGSEYKIAKNVAFAQIFGGTMYLLTTDKGLYQLDLKSSSKAIDKIASDVQMFFSTADGKYLYFTKNGDSGKGFYCKEQGKDYEKILDDYSKMNTAFCPFNISVSGDSVAYIVNNSSGASCSSGTLYLKTAGQDAEKIAQDVAVVVPVTQSGYMDADKLLFIKNYDSTKNSFDLYVNNKNDTKSIATDLTLQSNDANTKQFQFLGDWMMGYLALSLNSYEAVSSGTSASGSAAPTSSTAPAASASNPAPAKNATPTPAPAVTTDPSNTSVTFLNNMMNYANKGLVFNSEYPVETSTIDDVISVWGQPDKSEYIADAKGTYDTYSNKYVVYGYNKGDEIFEVRSLDPLLGALTLSQVENVYGTPDYTSSLTGQQIIGYVVNSKYKMLLVFNTAAGAADPTLDHYSVLFPEGTVNSMAGDTGRQW